MVTAADLRAIGEVSGLCREDFCDPFPGEIPIGENLTCTFNWELKRTGTGSCFYRILVAGFTLSAPGYAGLIRSCYMRATLRSFRVRV